MEHGEPSDGDDAENEHPTAAVQVAQFCVKILAPCPPLEHEWQVDAGYEDGLVKDGGVVASSPVDEDETDRGDEAEQAVNALADHHRANAEQAEDRGRKGDGGDDVDLPGQKQAELEGNTEPEYGPRCRVPTG